GLRGVAARAGDRGAARASRAPPGLRQRLERMVRGGPPRARPTLRDRVPRGDPPRPGALNARVTAVGSRRFLRRLPMTPALEVRGPALRSYPDVYTEAALAALAALAPLNRDRREVMARRIARRRERAREG